MAAHDTTQHRFSAIAKALWQRRVDAMCTALLLSIPVCLAAITGNLNSTPRFIDDNQIYMLDRQFHERGFFWVIQDHFGERLFQMKRLVPVYLAHKLFQVRLLDKDLIAWSLYTALLGGVTACVLYAFGRLMRWTVFEALSFSLIVVLGEQSVLWWRYLHGEGIGLLLVSLALVCIPLHLRDSRRPRLFQTLFIAFAALASLCKESFVLLLPALVLVFLFEDGRRHGGTATAVLKRNAALIAILGILCAIELVTIRFFLGRTYFYYTGWSGFDAARLVATALEFFSFGRSWIVALVIGAGALVHFQKTRNNSETSPSGNALGGGLILIAIALAIVLPQFLLYMSSGFSGLESVNFSRYLVPATFALALLVILPMQWIRRLAASGIDPRLTRRAWALCSAALVLYLVLRGAAAVEAGREFSRATDDVAEYLDAISYHTGKEDPVLIAVGKYNVHDNIRRVAVLLTDYLGLRNLNYVPITAADPVTSFEWLWSETNAYTERVEAATIYDASTLYPGTVLIPFDDHAFIPLESLFLLQEANWFDPAHYLRYENDHGDVAYFRTGNLPDSLRNVSVLEENAPQ